MLKIFYYKIYLISFAGNYSQNLPENLVFTRIRIIIIVLKSPLPAAYGCQPPQSLCDSSPERGASV